MFSGNANLLSELSVHDFREAPRNLGVEGLEIHSRTAK